MITLRPEQLRALSNVPEEVFHQNLCDFLRQTLPFWTSDLDDDELRWRVQSAVRRARSHGFRWQQSIAIFVALMFRIAPNFDEYPPIQALLGSGEDESRADRLLTEVPATDWEAASARYDPEGWYTFSVGP